MVLYDLRYRTNIYFSILLHFSDYLLNFLVVLLVYRHLFIIDILMIFQIARSNLDRIRSVIGSEILGQ